MNCLTDQTGNLEAWLVLFLADVGDASNPGAAQAKALMKLAAEDELSVVRLGTDSSSALRVHGLLPAQSLASIGKASQDQLENAMLALGRRDGLTTHHRRHPH